jgi:ABC-type antimicrobial peptide transport system permease subunit
MPYPALQVVVRVAGEPAFALPILKREAKATDPRFAISKPRAVTEVFADALAQRRFSMRLIAFFAVAALVLAIVGLYGVMTLSVNHRRREIGVRMAIGARAIDVLRLVLGEGMWITALGVALGIVGSLAASRVLTNMLYGVSATNASVYVAAAIATCVVTLIATLVPARRATRVDPTTALRGE